MNEVGFFSALKGTCSGVRIFFRLRGNSWDRTILHLFLLSLLCAGFITVMQGYRFFQEVEKFNGVFGGIRQTRNGFEPKTAPGEARTFAFSIRGRIFYFPAVPEQGITIPERELMLTDYGVVWTPKLLVVLFRLPENSWQCSTIPIGLSAMFPSAATLVANSELPGYLAGLRQPSWESTREFEYVVPQFVLIACGAMFGLNLMTVFLLPLFYTSFFMLVFRLSGGGRGRVLSLGEFWKVGIYAGFPVMLFAGFFPAFDLPFFRYGMVYMIGLVVYWLIVAGRIEQAEAEGGNPDE